MRFFKCFIVVFFSCAAFAHQYGINLMWINSKYDDDQKYFCATSKNEEDYKNNCIDPITSWLMKTSPDAPVRVWYDSALTPKQLVNDAVQDIKKKLGNNDAMKKLQFLDVRKIDDILQYPKVFSEKLPVYFRSDLLRAIVADYLARHYPHEYIVYADFNIPALSRDQLFDQKTLENIKKFGFVMAKNAAFDQENFYENAFFIIDPKNQSLMQAHRKFIIEMNIKRAQEFLKSGYTKNDQVAAKGGRALCKSMFAEVVFVSYKPMLEYYLYLEMIAEIIIQDPKLEKNLTTLLNPSDDKGIAALYDAHESPLWHNKLYAYSPLYRVPDSEGPHKWLFKKGFANVSWATLFENSQNPVKMRRLYLSPVGVSDVEKAQKIVDEEKNRRKSINIIGHLSPHQFLNFPKFRWEFYKVYHLGTFTPFISLEQGIYSAGLMPIKDVNKPKSSFYNKPKPSGDDC